MPRFAHKKVGIRGDLVFFSSFLQDLCVTLSQNFGFCERYLRRPSVHPFKPPLFFNFLHHHLLCSVYRPAPTTVDAAPWVSSGRACVAPRRRDWPWLGPLRPHCSSWQECSWELFDSRRIGGSASHRHPLSTRIHTHAPVHTTLPHSQDDFACLPPIRPVCFLSPHYTAMRGAAALRTEEVKERNVPIGEKKLALRPRYCKSDHICIVK